MNTKKKVIVIILIAICVCFFMTACSTEVDNNRKDVVQTIEVSANLVETMPTPTDINYSLERYNLIRRAYWINGMREKAKSYPCPIPEMPIGYVVLFSESGSVIERFMVDGKVSSLNSYLTPDSEYYEICNGSTYTKYNNWLADVDGSFGKNDDGIFFFIADTLNYIEWSGDYLYSDIPFTIDDPVIKYEIMEE